MADSRDLLVRILGDDRSLQQAFTRTERRTKQFETRTQRIGGGLTRAFAAAGIALGVGVAVNQTRKMADAASDLNEQIAKSREIFGDSSAEIEEWSTTTARSFGIARVEALEATGTFGNLFRVVGLAPKAAADMSRSLVQLAADLASFNNADPSEVLQAIRSGLIGEAEPLRRYGVLLSETRVQQEALAETGKKNVKALTDQEKALARYQIILRDTAPAQGDFARTSDGLANQSRILRANLDDLSANIGGSLTPALTDAADVANRLFIVLDKFRGADFTPGFEFPDEPEWFKKLSGISGLDILQAILPEQDKTEQTAPGAKGPGQGIGEDIARRAREQAEETLDATRRAERDLDRTRKAFSEFTKGLGLKLDKAGLTPGLDDDIAALDEIERAIQRQIRREGRTFKLVEQLTNVRRQRAALVEQQAEDAAQRARDAFANIIDGLNLRLEQALSTPGFKDDLRALRKLEAAIKERIAAEGRTVDLLRQLNEVRERRQEVLRQQREQQRERRQSRQFEALGLTAEGEQRTASTGALKKRLATLREQLKGTSLDTEQTRGQLQRIAKVLSGQFGKVGEDVRKAILEMFRNISDALKSGDKSAASGGEITPGGIKQIDNLVKGLGLTDEQIAAIHERNQQIRRRPRSSAFGFGLEPSGGGRTSTTGVPHGAERSDVNIHVTLELDGKEIANSTIRHAQKQGNRRAPARRGRHGGRNLGLG